MSAEESRKRVVRRVLDVALTAVIAASVIAVCFVAVKYLAVFAGIACLLIAIANLALRYAPVRGKRTVA